MGFPHRLAIWFKIKEKTIKRKIITKKKKFFFLIKAKWPLHGFDTFYIMFVSVWCKRKRVKYKTKASWKKEIHQSQCSSGFLMWAKKKGMKKKNLFDEQRNQITNMLGTLLSREWFLQLQLKVKVFFCSRLLLSFTIFFLFKSLLRLKLKKKRQCECEKIRQKINDLNF